MFATLPPTLLDNVPTSLLTRSPDSTEESHARGGFTDVLERGVAIGFSVLALVFILLMLGWIVSKILMGRKEDKQQNEDGVDIEMGDGTGATGIQRVDGFVEAHLVSPQLAHVDDDVNKEENGHQSGRAKDFLRG